MKKFLIVFGVLLLIVGGIVLHILISGGFFREIKSGYSGNISRRIGIKGAEDLAICREDSFLIISSDDRAARFHGRHREGGLYKLDLKNPEATPVLLTGAIDFPFFPHGISMLKIDSGAYKLWVINHPRRNHTIEVFKLFGDSLVHELTLEDDALVSPNDLIAINKDQFYVTNDHQYRYGWRRIAEDYLGLALSDVRFYDGTNYTKVADDIAYANGINYDADRNLLFVASPRGFLVKVFEPKETGELTFIEDIDTGTGVDNIEFDVNGKLWIGCHPNLLAFAKYASGKADYSPSEIITIDYRAEGDYSVESVFIDEGELISASTVAIPFHEQIYIGNVMDDQMVVWNVSQ